MAVADLLIAVSEPVHLAHNQIGRRHLAVVHMAGHLNIHRQFSMLVNLAGAVVEQEHRQIGVLPLQQRGRARALRV